MRGEDESEEGAGAGPGALLDDDDEDEDEEMEDMDDDEDDELNIGSMSVHDLHLEAATSGGARCLPRFTPFYAGYPPMLGRGNSLQRIDVHQGG